MSYIPTLDEAYEILKKYNKDEFHLKHGKIVSGVMGYFAKEHDPENTEYWKVVGLLHDLDFELYPEEHCIKSQEIMKELGLEEGIIHATASHRLVLLLTLNLNYIWKKYCMQWMN